MPIFTVPAAFQPLRPLEQALCGELEKLPERIERKIRVLANGSNNTIKGPFLRWFLLEGIASTALPIAHVEIDSAVVEEILNLEATEVDLLLRFVGCTFREEVRLSDAVIIGFDMLGGCAPAINADRATVKGSMRIRGQYKPKPIRGPRLGIVRLCGATIHGNLDMRRCHLEPAQETDEKEDVSSGVDNVAQEHQDSPPLFADGLVVQGNVMLCAGFICIGEIRLNGCDIGRNIDCSGATLNNVGGHSLSAAGAHIRGSAYFRETAQWLTYPPGMPFTSKGSLRLEGATIDGNLDCSGGKFFATAFAREEQTVPSDVDLEAIMADGLKVGSNIQFETSSSTTNTFAAHGTVSLINARVGADFSCNKAHFSFPGEEPLCADGIVVEGTSFLDEIVTDGVVRFVQANLKQGLHFNGASFDPSKDCKSWSKHQSNIAANVLGGPSCGIYAPDAVVGGIFRWREVKKRKLKVVNPFVFFIPGAKANNIEDDQSSWAALDRFEMMGAQYETIADLSDLDVDWRLQELDRQYAQPPRSRESIKKFKLQPYIQLAKTFRAMGYEAAANRIIVQLERNKTRYSDIGPIRRFWRRTLDWFLRYGYSPFRPVLIVLAWAAITAVVFQAGYDSKLLVASKDNLETQAGNSPSSRPRIPFNAIVYAVDTLVPIVDLNQKKNWTIPVLSSSAEEPHEGRSLWKEACSVWQTLPNRWLGVFLIFNTFFGWFMTTLFAAGVSGLLRTGKGG